MKPRDTQRARVYRADSALIEIAKPLPTVRDVERFVARAWASKRVQAAFPASIKRYRVPRVRDGRGCRNASGGAGGITIPLWARNEAVVIHELAHTMICRFELSHNVRLASHGWHYCDAYLKLTLYLMGREAHDVLKAAFKANGVRFRAPRRARVVTAEERAVLVARLAAYRADQHA